MGDPASRREHRDPRGAQHRSGRIERGGGRRSAALLRVHRGSARHLRQTIQGGDPPAVVSNTPRQQPLGRPFANLFSANLSSSLGDGIARTAIPLLAVQITLDPLLISGIAALAMLPWLFFAIPAGILIDKVDRRMALAVASTVRTMLAVLLFVLTATGGLTIWWLYVVVFVYGMFETVYDGAIRAVVPSILPKAALPRGNSLIEAGEQVVQNFVAGPFTSLLFVFSALIPLGANAAVYALAAVLAFMLPQVASGRQFARAHAKTSDETVPWHRQFRDGYRFIMARPQLRTLWFISTADGLAFSMATASLVLFIVDRLGLPEALFGVFMLTGAVGSIAASLLTPRITARWGMGLTVACANLITAVSVAAIGVFPNLIVLTVGWIVVSAALTVWNVLIMSFRQSVIPGRLLGRVHGTWRTLLWGSMPVGSVLGGLLGRIDLALPFIVGGVISLFTALIWFRFFVSLPNPEDIDNGDEAALAAA
ncbi:hypothetical protein DF220_05310 [Salinibacterium hongtaonis]|uniref:Major facilitator superfamily (MFS) profile domain-containing protein n=1 Tax=Homoserinimonas hongtaonis TaxID=2079791 RepID=A0A2U1T0A7_9MICO|nr:hypothetical protein DF220_05310 [Salinibacterium hongtaonis]